MKILLVDDEKTAREILVNTLKKIGYSTIISACNGLEALDLITSEKPGVVLADIRMPGMDGLELLEQVRRKGLDTLFVFISGYDLFEYAKKGIQLGAFDYLLKPVRQSDLENVMDKAVRELEQKVLRKNNDVTAGIKLNQGLEFMRRKFIGGLVTQEQLSESYIKNKCTELGICLEEKRLCAAVIGKDTNLLSIIDDKNLLVFSLENIISELLGNQGIHTRFFDIEDGIACLLILDPGEEQAEYTRLKEVFAEIVRCIKEFLKINVTVGIGKIVEDYTSLQRSMDWAVKSITQRLVKGDCSVYCTYDAARAGKPIAEFDAKMEQEILDGFEKCAHDRISTVMQKLYSSFKESDVLDFTELKKLNLQLILTIYKALKQSKIDPSSLLGDEFLLFNEVNSLKNIGSMAGWMKEKTEIALEAISTNRGKGSRKVLDISMEYIRKNISRSISLESAAEHVNLSPGHLSRLFRQELDESFIDFVIHERINKARELLKECKYKANEVARLTGFNDEKHFYKTFKKLTGFTPNEYKKL